MFDPLTSMWVVMDTYGPLAGATVYQRTAAQVASDLLAVGLTPQEVEGIRFTFGNPSGFPADTTVTPNVVFAARGALRTCPQPPFDTPVALHQHRHRHHRGGD